MSPTSTARKATLLLFSVAVLLADGVGRTVHGQSALDGFDPNANGIVQIVVVQPDGKILIGGDFTTLTPNSGASFTRNHIARLNRDGTVDTAFDPNASGPVYSIAVQADGKILAGGSFNNIGGETRNNIARLDPANGVADSFNPNANGTVRSIAVQADGQILAGGDFTSIGTQTRNHIARLNPNGTADPFNPAPTGLLIETIVVQPDGKILVGGNFGSIGGQTRTHIARLDATTGLPDSFNPNASPGFFVVTAIALQADGKVLAGGTFTSIGGQTRNSIARLDATTGMADSFNPNSNNIVRSIAVQADGRVLVGGDFTNIGGQTRNRIARLNPDGTADSFDSNANLNVHTIAVQADGKILAGGIFTALSPNGGAAITRNNIARLETDGRLDQTLFLPLVGPFDGEIFATAVQSNGKILIGGQFSDVLSETRICMARLNTDGTLDTAFNANVGGGLGVSVDSIVVQADGKILVGGAFSSIGGQLRSGIARLDGTTGLADSFNPTANGRVYSIAVQADGKILAGGQFTTLTPNAGATVTRNRIARLNPDGTADSFDPNANLNVHTIAVQADGKILAGGEFTTLTPNAGATVTRNRIARLNPDGTADSFDPNANNRVYSIAVQADGKILAGGEFTTLTPNAGATVTRNRIARLNLDGTADSFDPNANNRVYSIAVQADGKILAGGEFTTLTPNAGATVTRKHIARLNPDGTADSFDLNPILSGFYITSIAVQADGKILVGGGELFLRLSNDTAALQDLAVSQTTVTWARGGSSPQFRRVTFESSTDNVNYSFLGNGIPQSGSSNWILTGLNLATGQNLYIRARGYSRGGGQNGSESIQESVRNAFLIAAPTPTPTPAFVSISGTVTYCSSPALPPVPGVTMSLTGPSPAPSSTPTNGSGVYTFSVLTSGASYTVTPSKSALTPGSAGISTVDVLAVQRHFLTIVLIPPGCRLTAADVNADTNVTTVDVIAVQRFFLGFATGIANVGKYSFSPASRSYTPLVSNQTAQNYDTIVFGDVVSGFVH